MQIDLAVHMASQIRRELTGGEDLASMVFYARKANR
jgi:hypothetical protein